MKAVVSKGKDGAAVPRAEAQTGVAKRIALIEDDADIAYTIRLNLRKEKRYQVEHYVSGIAALAALQEKPFDLVILDLNLPDIDGLALCRELRRADETRKVPIIMLTARVEERDKLLGFEIGADDYITKPFSMRELLARVHAHLRRVAAFETSEEEVFRDGELHVDRARFEVALRGERVHLTKKEFDLLWLLIRNRNRVVTRDAILARLWDYDADVETRTVDVHIRALRRKLGDQRIETVVGLGYRYRETAPASSRVARPFSTSRMRLRARFTALFAVLAAAAIVFLVLVSDATLGRAVEERVSDRFSRELEHLADDLAGGVVPVDSRDAFLRRSAATLDCRVTHIAPDGRVLEDTDLLPADVAGMENHAKRPEVLQALEGGTGRSHRMSPTEQKPMLYVARRLPDGSVLRLAVSQARLRDVELGYLWTMRLATLAVCLTLFLIGASASRRFSEPIAQLTRAASAVAAGDFARDLPTTGGEEVQLLGAALQRMKDSLNTAVDRAEAERRLTAMTFERLPDGLVVVDAKLRVIECNGRFSEMTGVPAPAGRGVYEVLRERPLYDCFDATVRTGEISERIVRLPDEVVWQITVAPLPEGHRGAALGVLRDVTRLERTEAMRRTFVADVSHELRTPIASIAAAAETLSEGQPDKTETAELLGLIRRQSDRIRELIDDLMDLAQIESGAVPLEREEVLLHELLSEIAEDFEPASREKRVEVRVSGDPAVAAVGDRRRLGQLARNLLDNAIKFSPEGAPVTVRVWQQSGRPGFTVADLGPGIPKAERDKIFQRFYQVDRSRSKVRPGSGLGLAIVKHIAQLHGAAVEVEGDVGEGSLFHVRFPAAVA